MRKSITKTLSLLIAVVILLCAVPFAAPMASAKTSGVYTYIVENKQAVIFRCKDTVKGNLKLPSKLGGYPVTRISGTAFYHCNKLTGVRISDSIKTIGADAFYECTNLKSVTIGKNVSNMRADAFSYRSKLEKLTVVSGNKTFHSKGNCIVETKSKRLVLGCKNSVIPADGSVTSIGVGAFATCTGLKKITVPNRVKSIENAAFLECDNLGSVKFPSSLTNIGNVAFSACKNLKNIKLPDGLTNIGTNAFLESGYYNNYKNWKDGVLYIGKHLIGTKNFYSEKYTIRKGTKCIAGSAFYGCEWLKTVRIPDTVTAVGESAFASCSRLTSIKIPKNVRKIGERVFEDSNSINSLTVASGNKVFHSEGNCIIETKAKKLVAGCKSSVIPANKSVKSIDRYAFSGCSLKSIKIPGNVKSIGEGAFLESTLSSVTFSTGLKTIGDFAFFRTALRSVKIPKGVKTLGVFAFENCEALKSIKLPDGISKIDGCAFSGTAYVKNSANWKGSGLYIDNYLMNVNMYTSGKFKVRKGTKYIADAAFRYCGDITDVSIPSSVVSIGEDAFILTNLNRITVPKSVKTIGSHAFGYDVNLDTGKFFKKTGFKISGEKGSAAEKYAKKNGFNFKKI